MRKKRRESLERNIKIMLITILLAIIIVVVIFFVKKVIYEPTFEYRGFTVSKVRITGINRTFYSLRVPVKIYGGLDVYEIYLRNDPRELLELEVEKDTRDKMLDPKPDQFYLTFDPDLEEKGYIALAMSEIARVTGTSSSSIFQIPTTGMVTKITPGYDESITCKTSNSKKAVVWLNLNETADRTRIYIGEGEKCVVLEANNYDELIKAADKFVLTLLGI